MTAQPEFDAALILALGLAGTFAFAISGGMAATDAHFDLFGVIVMAAVVGLAGGIMRDVLLGVRPTALGHWEFLVAGFAGGLVAFFLRTELEAVWEGLLFFDAVGLSVFCVTGASQALDHQSAPLQAVVLAATTAIGGGVLRDVLLNEVPNVFRHDLYAVPALLGASVFVLGSQLTGLSLLPAVAGASICLALRLVAMRFHLGLPIAPGTTRPETGGAIPQPEEEPTRI
jgi:uncharacterized membrane protein YeiH